MRTACALLGALLASLLLPALGHAEPPTPAADIQFGPLPRYCERPSRPAVCGEDEIYELDQARAAMDLPPYSLPPDFLKMTPDRQMLILADLDRSAYSLPPIEGLNDGLGANAAAAAGADADPRPSEADLGRPLHAYTSNWAQGFPTALQAYFFWVYADGYGSGNVDCGAPTDAGCWIHRRDILWEPASLPGSVEGYAYSMGAAATTDANGSPAYALSVVVSGGAIPLPTPIPGPRRWPKERARTPTRLRRRSKKRSAWRSASAVAAPCTERSESAAGGVTGASERTTR